MLREWGITTLVAMLALVIICQVYQVFNLLTNEQGALLLLQNTLIRSQTIEMKEALVESIEFKIQDVFNPVKLMYAALPYYKSKNITLGVYQEELTGFFKMPENEEMITLEEENIYVPEMPEIKQQDISTALLDNPKYLLDKIYTGDKELQVNEELLSRWDFRELAERKLVIDESIEGPKVLIFYTHIKEAYPSKDNEEMLGISQVGNALAQTLEEEYGLETLQVTEDFYPSIESYDNTGNYERMEPVIRSVLKDNPSIQIVIDLHRDGVKKGVHLKGEIEGEPVAKMMFVNGLCMHRNAEGELVEKKYLQNPYIEENLAFALQAQLIGMEYYPEMMRKIYFKPYRYSLHMVPYSLLIELGAQTNTPEEAMNAVEPIAHMIGKVLVGD